MDLKEFEKELKKHPKQPLSKILVKEAYCKEEGIAWEIAKEGYIKSMTQLRDFFAPIDDLHEALKLKNLSFESKEELSKNDFYKLLPLHFQLANRVERKVITKEFYFLMKDIIDEKVLKTYSDFFLFHEFLCAIIAYCNFLKPKD